MQHHKIYNNICNQKVFQAKKTEQNNAQGSDDSEATSDTGSPKITVNFVDNNENPIKKYNSDTRWKRIYYR